MEGDITEKTAKISNRRNSILKSTAPITVKEKLPRRISFSDRKSVKEFTQCEDKGTIWVNSYQESEVSSVRTLSSVDSQMTTTKSIISASSTTIGKTDKTHLNGFILNPTKPITSIAIQPQSTNQLPTNNNDSHELESFYNQIDSIQFSSDSDTSCSSNGNKIITRQDEIDKENNCIPMDITIMPIIDNCIKPKPFGVVSCSRTNDAKNLSCLDISDDTKLHLTDNYLKPIDDNSCNFNDSLDFTPPADKDYQLLINGQKINGIDTNQMDITNHPGSVRQISKRKTTHRESSLDMTEMFPIKFEYPSKIENNLQNEYSMNITTIKHNQTIIGEHSMDVTNMFSNTLLKRQMIKSKRKTIYKESQLDMTERIPTKFEHLPMDLTMMLNNDAFQNELSQNHDELVSKTESNQLPIDLTMNLNKNLTKIELPLENDKFFNCKPDNLHQNDSITSKRDGIPFRDENLMKSCVGTIDLCDTQTFTELPAIQSEAVDLKLNPNVGEQCETLKNVSLKTIDLCEDTQTFTKISASIQLKTAEQCKNENIKQEPINCENKIDETFTGELSLNESSINDTNSKLITNAHLQKFTSILEETKNNSDVCDTSINVIDTSLPNSIQPTEEPTSTSPLAESSSNCPSILSRLSVSTIMSTTALERKRITANDLKLNWSKCVKFNNMATVDNVLKYYQQKLTAKEAEIKERETFERINDQNVVAPSLEFLLENKWNENRSLNQNEPKIIVKKINIGAIYPICPTIDMLINNLIKHTFNKVWRYNSTRYIKGDMKISHCSIIKSAIIHIKFDRNTYDENLRNYGVIYFNNVSIQRCPYSGNTAMETLAYQDLVYQLKHNGGICRFNTSEDAHNHTPTQINITPMCETNKELAAFLEKLAKYYHTSTTRVAKLYIMAINNDFQLHIEDGRCYLQYDEQINIDQKLEINITLDEMDLVGPKCVYLTPVKLFKSHIHQLKTGMEFLEAFTANPISFIEI